MKTVIIGAGLGGLIAAHVSNYTPLVLDSGKKLASNLGEMIGTRFVGDSAELRHLFGYNGPSSPVLVTYDEADAMSSLTDYIRKTRNCDLRDIPEKQRPSMEEWGLGSFDRLPIDVNGWFDSTAQKAGVVFGSWIDSIKQEDSHSSIVLSNGSSVPAAKIVSTIPLPFIMRIVGIPGADKFRALPITIGRYQVDGLQEPLPATIHHITTLSSPVSRIITHDRYIIVEAPSYQDPRLMSIMMEEAESRARDLHANSPVRAVAFATFHHHFVYFSSFEEHREKALAALKEIGIYSLGRHARYDNSLKLLETYRQAKQMVTV